jgi:hypothetical protein
VSGQVHKIVAELLPQAVGVETPTDLVRDDRDNSCVSKKSRLRWRLIQCATIGQAHLELSQKARMQTPEAGTRAYELECSKKGEPQKSPF